MGTGGNECTGLQGRGKRTGTMGGGMQAEEHGKSSKINTQLQLAQVMPWGEC